MECLLCARYCAWVEWIDNVLSEHGTIDGCCLQCGVKMTWGPELAGGHARGWQREMTEFDSVLAAYDGTVTI